MSETPRNTACDGLLLCGGRGRRCGGRDKGLLRLPNGPTAAQSGADLLRPLCSTLYVSANRNLSTYRQLTGGCILKDLRTGYPGPLGALEAVAVAEPAPILLLLPCDMRGVDTDVMRQLHHALWSSPSLDWVYASQGGRRHYLLAALRSRCLSGLGAQLDAGKRAVHRWLDRVSHATVEVRSAAHSPLENWNTLADWESGGAGPAASTSAR